MTETQTPREPGRHATPKGGRWPLLSRTSALAGFGQVALTVASFVSTLFAMHAQPGGTKTTWPEAWDGAFASTYSWVVAQLVSGVLLLVLGSIGWRRSRRADPKPRAWRIALAALGAFVVALVVAQLVSAGVIWVVTSLV